MRLLSGRAGCCTLGRGAPAGGFGVFRMIPRFFWNVDFQWTDSRRLFGGGFEDMEHEGCGGGLLGGVLLVRRVVAKASECVSPLRLDGTSRMVGRRLACRDAAGSRARHSTREIVPQPARSSLNPRARTSSRRARGLSDVLGGYPTISRTAAPGAAAPRTSRCAFHPRERRLDHRGPAERKWPEQESATMSPLNKLHGQDSIVEGGDDVAAYPGAQKLSL